MIRDLLRLVQHLILPGLGLLLILLAVLFSSARLMLPMFDEQLRLWLEGQARKAGVTLQAGTLALDWHGLGPRLILTHATLVAEDGGTPLQLEHLALGLNLPHSLMTARLQLASLEMEGVQLILARDVLGRWQLPGVLTLPAASETPPTWPTWLGLVQHIKVVEGRLTLHDQKSGQTVVFQDIEALLEQGVGDVGLALRLTLPPSLGGKLELHAQLEEPLDLASGPTGQVWLATTGLDMAGWSALFAQLAGTVDLPILAREELPRFEKGAVRGQAWLTLKAGEVTEAQTRLELADWRLIPLQALRAGEREITLATRLDLLLRHEGKSWQLDLQAIPRDTRHPPQRFSLRREQDRLAMAGEQFDLDLLRPWLVAIPVLPERLRQALIRHRPSGRLAALHLAMQLGDSVWPELEGHARFEGLGWRGEGYLPDVANVRGEVWLTGQAALLRLDSPGLVADFHGKFREPLRFEQASVDLALFWADTPRLMGRHLQLANRDLALQAQLQLDLPDDGAPRIDLTGRFQRARAERVPAYLPVEEIGHEALIWLDRALPHSGGFVPEGTFKLYGDLTRFPYYDDGSGLFEVRFAFQDLRLDYAPGWRPAERLHGELAFINNGLVGRIDGGHLRGLSLREGWLAIPDFDHPRLDLRLGLAGKVESMLEILKASPLIKDRTALDEASLTGPASLNLTVEVRLDDADPRPDQAQGWLDLHGARLLAYEQLFEAIEGRLMIHDDRLEAQAIRTRYRGREALLAVSSEPRGNGYAYRLRLETQTEARDWLEAGSPWARRLSGAFPVQAELTLDPKAPRGRPFELELSSTLEGLAIDLPAPLGKSAEAARPTRARLTWRAGRLERLGLEQAGLLSTLLELADGRVRSGQLVLGEGTPLTPPGEGRLLVEARLPVFELGAWLPILETPAEGEASLPSKMDLRARFDRLEALGEGWEGMQVQGQRDASGWRLRLESPRLAGLVRLPARPSPAEPLSLDLARLIFSDEEERPALPDPNAPPPADPTTLPPLKVSVTELYRNGMRLKDVRLKTLPQPRGLLIQDAAAETGHLRVRGEGSWLLDDKNHHQTTLTLNLSSDDVGSALDELGFAKTLRKGRLEDTQLRLRWPDAPDRFAWSILGGEARLNVRDGVLEKVEPGAGRVLGLLSLAELPRRLLLDFGDVFGEGLRFERIAATLSFRDGQAVTELLQLSGPAAQVVMKGYSDMVQRTLHYDMVVVPALGNVLPILGTVAGGPLVGGAMFLLQKVFDQLGGEKSGFNYRVSGSWDDPKIERVEK